MCRTVLAMFLTAVLASTAAGAESLPVGSGLVLQLPELAERWQVSRSAPKFLIDETAEHLEHELAAQGKQPSAEQIRQAAAKRLAANEAFVCNPASGACLVIDFSPLREDESPPAARQVAASARYAAEGLAEEEGVSRLRQKTGRGTIPGAAHAWRIDAGYDQHGKAKQFVGYVGFAQPSWFYLYYTDPLADPEDLQQMEKVLRALSIRREGAGK